MIVPSQACAVIVCAILISGCSGLGTSRWAMEDSVYADKYSDAYSTNKVEKIARMMKQSADARFLAGRKGVYGGLGGLGAELGVFRLPTSYSEVRAGVKGQLNSGTPTAGLDLSARLQTPARLSPFIGIGSYLGGGDTDAHDDGIDNDRDGITDEFDEERDQLIFSVYPEAGVHFWLNPSTRVSVLGQYHMTPQGGADDFGYVGFQISLMEGVSSQWRSGGEKWSPLTSDDN
jgi:hypothetical protein